MANYSLVANSTFQPFSYQELMAPVARMSEYHEKLADEYDKLSSQADVLEAMGANDRDKDSKVYQQYKNYSDRLRAEADNLYRNGLNTESRMRLSELRRMYNTDIVPIQNAWNKREKEAELQMKAQLDASSRGVDLYFSRNAADTPLQSYLDNPNQTFRTINGQALMNEVAAQFKGLANQLQEGKIKKEQLSPIEYRIITNKGMDFNEYMDFINNPNAPEFKNIRGIVNGTLAAHGAQEFDPTTQQRLFGLASQGVAAGVGARDMQFHTDEWAKMQETYKQQQSLNGGNGTSGNSRVNPLPLRSQSEISEKNKEIQEYIRAGYVKQDAFGNYTMTHEGWEEYRKMKPNDEKKQRMLTEGSASVYNPETKKMPDTVPSKFRQFMDELNGGKPLTDSKGNALPGWGPRRAGNLFASGIKKYEEGSYDTYHSTEYDRQLDSEYGSEFTRQMWSAARRANGKAVLDVVDYNGKDGFNVKESKGVSDLEGYKVTNVRLSNKGNTAIMQKDGEEPIRVKIPKGMNVGAEENVNAAIANADDLGVILNRGKRPKTKITADGETVIVKDRMGNIEFTQENLTADDRAALIKYRRDYLNDMEEYGSQIVVPSTTKNDEHKPFSF